MRKIFVSNFVSLDGYLEGPGGDLSWHAVDEEFISYAEEMLNSVDTILFGKKTYQMMAAYWPADKTSPRIAAKMNGLQKIVFSKTLDNVDDWGNCILVKDDVEAYLRKLKDQPGKDMVILGSGSIVSAFTQMGIIDEYCILINPVILGAGNLQFTGHIDKKLLKLTDIRRFSSGLVMLSYQPK